MADTKLYEDPDHWDRFLEYSKRVRRLFYDSSVCGDAQIHLFHILLEHNGGTPFLPSLRAIEWKRASSQDYSFAVAFAPGLVDVTLSFARQGSSAQLWRDIDLKPLQQPAVPHRLQYLYVRRNITGLELGQGVEGVVDGREEDVEERGVGCG